MKNVSVKLLIVCLLAVMIFPALACGGKTQSPSETDENKKPANAGTIRIATKNTTEQNILATLAKILIEEKTDNKAEIIYYDDSTASTLLNKAEKDSIQVFFDYTGNIALNGLKQKKDDINIGTLLQDLQNDLNLNHDLTLSEEIGYQNTTVLCMMNDRKEEMGGISNCSELQDLAGKLIIGMPESFYSRQDCYESFCKEYKLKFKKDEVLDEDKGFAALAEGTIDIYVASSISPWYSMFEAKQINDDKHFFLPQYTCFCINNKTLNKNQEIESALSTLEGLIDNNRMSLMIRRISKEGKNIENYLYTYLRANNIV